MLSRRGKRVHPPNKILMPTFLPDWAPNAHPLIMHFPIALLFAAAGFDLVGILARDKGGWRNGANWLYAVGALATLATWYSGTLAADSVFLPARANALLTEHADLGKWTMWLFCGYGVVRSGLSFTPLAQKGAMRVGLFLIGAASLSLLAWTATHGAELVYRYGVGVEAVETRPSAPVISESNPETGIATTSDGWLWTPARAAAWKQDAVFLEGSADDLKSSIVDGGERGDVFEFSVSSPSLFVLPGDVDRLQADLSIDVSDFDGTVYVAHHVTEDASFGFTALASTTIRLGRTEKSDLIVEATEAFDGSDWRDIRVVVDGAHFRSYVDTKLVVHGHGAAYDVGRVGLRLNGTGVVRLASMHIVDLGLAAAGAEAADDATMEALPGAEDDHEESADHEHGGADEPEPANK
ncbi:MAG: putative membrane protein [Rhodothermales bacterium]